MLASDVLNVTVAQALAWLTSFGIAAAVAYVLGGLPNLNDNVKRVIQVVASAMLIAGVTAVAQFIPQSWLDMRLVDCAIVLFGVFVTWAGVWFGSLKGMQHASARISARSL